MGEPLRLFCCYACLDKQYLEELKKHLAVLQHEGLIDVKDDTDIPPGTEREKEIHRYLEQAHILLLLISSDFIFSNYYSDIEVQKALIRYQQGIACVIPVILRTCSWKGLPFGKLQALPTDARAVLEWPNRDEAYTSIVEGIRTIAQKFALTLQQSQQVLSQTVQFAQAQNDPQASQMTKAIPQEKSSFTDALILKTQTQEATGQSQEALNAVREAERVRKEEESVLGHPSEEMKKSARRLQRMSRDRIPVEWVFIPEGSAMMEKVESFFISKYPITYRQFQAFIDDENGYSNDRWWEELAVRFDQPAKARWPISDHPREMVSWYEAIAFCQWLSSEIGRKVILPTEAQWQRAAQGDDNRDYSWGKAFSKTRCNTSESGIRQTTSVNRYSSDASPYGVMDMCGNVKEWCLNEHISPTKIDLGGDAPRALRGGSWKNGYLSARVSARDFGFPHHRLDTIGFRIVTGTSGIDKSSPSSSPP